MSKEKVPSFKKINYYLRPNKQVERKVMIDILQKCRNEIDLSNHCYVGMGSIYYYDFILLHKNLGITNLKSIDNKTTTKRFDFNKPYEFIEFKNCSTTDYLNEHDWEQNKTIVWLDYDGNFAGNDYLLSDISILSKYCRRNDFIFISIAIHPPKSENREQFLEVNKRYISPKFNNFKSVAPKNFHLLVQNIILNMIKEKNEYNDHKFIKLCSFLYKDGAPMYTLGGVFSDEKNLGKKLKKLHESIEINEEQIQQIEVPNITYKEKFYLDGNINTLNRWLKYYGRKVDKLELKSTDERNDKLQEFLSKRMEFELTPEEISNYIQHYKYFPQYYEGIV